MGARFDLPTRLLVNLVLVLGISAVFASRERRELEELQRRSSMHQPMYREQLAAHPDALDLSPEQIAAGLVRVAELSGATVGFATLLEPVSGACELDALFVEPEQMRNGIGRRPIEDAAAIAQAHGAARIEVVAIRRRSPSTKRSGSEPWVRPRRASGRRCGCRCLSAEAGRFRSSRTVT